MIMEGAATSKSTPTKRRRPYSKTLKRHFIQSSTNLQSHISLKSFDASIYKQTCSGWEQKMVLIFFIFVSSFSKMFDVYMAMHTRSSNDDLLKSRLQLEMATRLYREFKSTIQNVSLFGSPSPVRQRLPFSKAEITELHEVFENDNNG